MEVAPPAMPTAIRLLLLTLITLLLQGVPAWAHAKEAPVKSPAVPQVLKGDATGTVRCSARYALLTAWEEPATPTAANHQFGVAGDEERTELHAPSMDTIAPTPSPKDPPAPWVLAVLPELWLPVLLRPPIALGR